MGSKQVMVEQQNKEGDGSVGTVNGYSTSNYTLLHSLFPSPITDGLISDASQLEAYAKTIKNPSAQNGFQFDSPVNMMFQGNPDIGSPPHTPDIEYKDPGDPASAWVPNPMSPGAGNGTDPLKVPKPPAGFGDKEHATDTPFVGNNLADPATTTKKIVGANTLGEALIMGHSYAGSGE